MKFVHYFHLAKMPNINNTLMLFLFYLMAILYINTRFLFETFMCLWFLLLLFTFLYLCNHWNQLKATYLFAYLIR